jgi:hypothetical protein
MPRYGRTTAPMLPLVSEGNVTEEKPNKFLDKESQAMIDKIRKEHSLDYVKNKHKEYNPKVDQQRIWSERSPAAYQIPYQSLGKESHLNHPQLKESSKSKKIKK